MHIRIISTAAVVYAVLALTGVAQSHPGLDEQIVALTADIDKDPENGLLFLRRGEVHRMHREWDSAVTDYRQATKLDPELHIVGLCLAKLRLESGKPKEARKLIDSYIKGHAEGAEAWVIRARSNVALGRYLEAAEDFTSAIEAAGSRPAPDYYLERAQALVASGTPQIPQAVRGLDDGIKRHGFSATLETYALDLERRTKKYDAALDRLDGILARSKRHERWLVLRGEILEEAGRPELALDAYRRSLAAIETLPGSRRNVRAVRDLMTQAQSAVNRLDATQ